MAHDRITADEVAADNKKVLHFSRGLEFPEPKEEEGLAPITADEVDTAARSALSGTTLGVSEPVISSVNALIGSLIDAGYDGPSIDKFFSDLSKNYKSDVERRKSLKEKYPDVHGGAELTGAIGSAFVPGAQGALLGKAGKVLGSGATAAGKLAKRAGKAVESIPGAKAALEAKNLGGSLARAGRGAAEGAAIGAGTTAIDQTVQGASGFKDPSKAKEHIESGLEYGAGLGLVPSAYRGLKLASKRTLSNLGQVRPAVIDAYLRNHQTASKANSVANMKEIFDDTVNKIKNGILAKKDRLTESKNEALEALGEKVAKGSSHSYDILDKIQGYVPASRIKSLITRAKHDFEIVKKQGTFDEPGTKALKFLQALHDSLDNYGQDIKGMRGKQIPFPVVKKILQRYDNHYVSKQNSGEFLGDAQELVNLVRIQIDKLLKELSHEAQPQMNLSGLGDYAEKMLEVSSDTHLLKKASQKFGQDEPFTKKLPGLNQKNYPVQAVLLKELEKRSGVPLIAELEEIQRLDPIMHISKDNSQQFLKTIFFDSSVENLNTLRMIESLQPAQLEQMIRDTGTLNAFTKEFEPGSRNIKMWTGLGSVASGLGSLALGADFKTIVELGGLGGFLGGFVKYYGAPITKSVLDGYVKMNGLITLRKIQQYMPDVPADLVLRLKNDLIMEMARPSDAQIPIPRDKYMQMIVDLDGATNLNSVEKAKAIDGMNRNGTIPANTLRSVMLDNGQGGTVEEPNLIEDEDEEEEAQNPDVDQVIENMEFYN